jgi:hypothetical protein
MIPFVSYTKKCAKQRGFDLRQCPRHIPHKENAGLLLLLRRWQFQVSSFMARTAIVTLNTRRCAFLKERDNTSGMHEQ